METVEELHISVEDLARAIAEEESRARGSTYSDPDSWTRLSYTVQRRLLEEARRMMSSLKRIQRG